MPDNFIDTPEKVFRSVEMKKQLEQLLELKTDESTVDTVETVDLFSNSGIEAEVNLLSQVDASFASHPIDVIGLSEDLSDSLDTLGLSELLYDSDES